MGGVGSGGWVGLRGFWALPRGLGLSDVDCFLVPYTVMDLRIVHRMQSKRLLPVHSAQVTP